MNSCILSRTEYLQETHDCQLSNIDLNEIKLVPYNKPRVLHAVCKAQDLQKGDVSCPTSKFIYIYLSFTLFMCFFHCLEQKHK
jgi:hypothetical protein